MFSSSQHPLYFERALKSPAPYTYCQLQGLSYFLVLVFFARPQTGNFQKKINRSFSRQGSAVSWEIERGEKCARGTGFILYQWIPVGLSPPNIIILQQLCVIQRVDFIPLCFFLPPFYSFSSLQPQVTPETTLPERKWFSALINF